MNKRDIISGQLSFGAGLLPLIFFIALYSPYVGSGYLLLIILSFIVSTVLAIYLAAKTLKVNIAIYGVFGFECLLSAILFFITAITLIVNQRGLNHHSIMILVITIFFLLGWRVSRIKARGVGDK